MAGRFFDIPFAANGDRTLTPDAVQPDGSVSYSEGFGFDYERASTDPAYKPVPRDGMNGLFFDLTQAMGIVQKQGFADWTTDAQPYAINSTVRHNGVNWCSLIATNNDEPGVGPGATSWRNIAVPESTPLPLGYFSGFTLSNDGSAPNTTISVGAGAARDSTNANNIELSSTLRGILQSSGVWAAGDNQNKLDAGARANLKWYHVFVIRKTSNGSTDILFSLSATAPNMPSGYSGFRRIGSVRTDGSGNIFQFLNVGRKFYWGELSQDVAASGVASGSTTITLRVPTGVRVTAHVDAMIRGENNALYLRPTGTTAPTMAGSSTNAWIAGIGQNADGSTTEAVSASTSVVTNTSGQVAAQYFAGAGNLAYVVTTKYWEEF